METTLLDLLLINETSLNHLPCSKYCVSPEDSKGNKKLFFPFLFSLVTHFSSARPREQHRILSYGFTI